MFKQYLKVATYIKYICSEVVVKIILGLIVTATYVGQAICLARGTAGTLYNPYMTTKKEK